MEARFSAALAAARGTIVGLAAQSKMRHQIVVLFIQRDAMDYPSPKRVHP
jgi:hypothetical protein